jgi:HTH-type transcriptional regulator/antitoxin MqsA
MYPKRCAECGGAVVVSTDDVTFEVRGEQVVVPGIEHGRCTVCGEEFFTLEGSERLQKEAVRRSKQARGLLAPEEILALRHSLHLTQTQFEDLLGVGPKTVVRWEKGTVYQSATADRLMRLMRLMPDVQEVLASGTLYAKAATASTHTR